MTPTAARANRRLAGRQFRGGVGFPTSRSRRASRARGHDREVHRPAAQDALSALSPVSGSPGRGPDKPPEVKSWRWPQGANPHVVAIIRGPCRDRLPDNGAFTKAQVEQMQRKSDGSRRIMLSLHSPAPIFRWYWPNRSSTWLGPEN
jgi:hypothetical protein